eukprot:COSAG02_NODE_665_length_18739_cov_9.192918_14_plen_534_part_00
MFVGDGEPDVNLMDPPVTMLNAELQGGARAKKKTAKPKATTEPKRVLVAGLTAPQDELLRTVQYRTGLLAGRDSLYLATRQYIDDSGSDVKQPTKRQVGAWLKGEPGMERQQTTGAALPKHKPVAVIRRSRPLMYLQFDTFQLDEREIPDKDVTYTNKKGKRVTVPLVNRFALIVVDAFSKFVWVRLLQTPKGAGVAAAWDGLKTNADVIGIAKALDSVFTEINADLQDRDPPERLKDLRIKAGSDNGSENVGPDIDRVMRKWNVLHELGIKGRPMSQALAESHVGVWKRRFASWVRSRMDAVKEQDEESRRAKEIKQSWVDLADTITASVNSAWMRQFPRPYSRIDVHYGDEELIKKIKEHQDKEFGKRAKAYEADNKPRYAVGDIVRRRVARSGKLDAAFSQRLYQVIRIQRYYKVNRPAGFKIAPVNNLDKPEPGLYRAEQLKAVALDDDGNPVQNQLGTADVEALNDPSAREYVPWRVLDERKDQVLVQWRGYPRDDATWEKKSDLPENFVASYKGTDDGQEKSKGDDS